MAVSLINVVLNYLKMTENNVLASVNIKILVHFLVYSRWQPYDILGRIFIAKMAVLTEIKFKMAGSAFPCK